MADLDVNNLRDLPIEAFSSTSGLKLDLYNFESTYAEDSPYILTSPRSLEACAQLDLKVCIYFEFEVQFFLKRMSVKIAT